jgi:hypothetical protein
MPGRLPRLAFPLFYGYLISRKLCSESYALKTNILLYLSESLLDCGVYSLIAADQNKKLTVLKDSSLDELINTADQIKPDVIILEQRSLSSYSGLLNRLLKGRKNTKVITFDEDQNLLHVYSSHEVSVEKASDLLSILSPNNFNSSISK